MFLNNTFYTFIITYNLIYYSIIIFYNNWILTKKLRKTNTDKLGFKIIQTIPKNTKIIII